MKSAKKDFHIVLAEVVTDFGRDTIADERAEGLMADLMGKGHTLGPVMKHMRQSGISRRLLGLDFASQESASLDIDNMKLMLQDNFFIRPSVASYVVDSYCFALGLTDDFPKLKETEETGDCPSGELSFATEEDGDFCGYKNDDGLRSGFGILRSQRGDTYAGEWRVGMKIGYGMGFDCDGSRYAGEWRMNRHSGIGVESLSNGLRYAGQWKNGRRNGPGMVVFPNGNALCGIFRDGRYQPGYGAFVLYDGSIVVGNMEAEGPDGECVHVYGNGQKVTEEWSHGNKLN